MLGNITNLFFTKGRLYHLLGLLEYHVMYRNIGSSQFCEMSAKVTYWVTDSFRWFCEK